MKKLIAAAMFLTALMTTQLAEAQRRDVNRKGMTTMNNRIQQGVRQGQLDRREAHKLRMKMVKIRAMKRMAMADRRMDYRERRMLRNAHRNTSASIYRQRHDRDTRWDNR